MVDENGKPYDIEPIMKSVSVVGGNQGGNQGGDSGNQGGDSGNQGGDSGNQGGDSGNQGGDSGNQGGNSGNQGGGTDVSGALTAAQAKAEAESLNLNNKEYSQNSYKVVAYAIKVTVKTLSSGSTVYDIDLSDTADGTKIFTLYHGNLSGSDVPAVGDKVLVEGYFTRYDYSDGSSVLQIGGNQTLGFATVKVAEKGNNQGGTTTPGGDSGNQGGTTTTPEGTTVVIDLTGKGEAGSADGSSTGGTAFATITQGDITIDASAGTNTNAPPKYYPESLRLYGSNTMTITAAAGKTIKSITFTYGKNDKTNAITVDVGTFATDTWTGSANSIVFSIASGSGHRRIATITIVYE